MNINWKLFWALFAACFVGVVALIPYSLELGRDALEQAGVSDETLFVLIPLQIIQNMVIFGAALVIGLLLAPRAGLGAPFLEKYLNGEKADAVAGFRKVLGTAVILGIAAGVLIIISDVLFSVIMPASVAGAETAAVPSALSGLLASLYGAINEEVLLRLFLMTILVWIGMKIAGVQEGVQAPAVMWLALILAAVLFGASHLPAALSVFPELTAPVIARIITLNTLGGIIFGWLYWRKGLESAMVAHGSADIVLHVMLPLLL